MKTFILLIISFGLLVSIVMDLHASLQVRADKKSIEEYLKYKNPRMLDVLNKVRTRIKSAFNGKSSLYQDNKSYYLSMTNPDYDDLDPFVYLNSDIANSLIAKQDFLFNKAKSIEVNSVLISEYLAYRRTNEMLGIIASELLREPCNLLDFDEFYLKKTIGDSILLSYDKQVDTFAFEVCIFINDEAFDYRLNEANQSFTIDYDELIQIRTEILDYKYNTSFYHSHAYRKKADGWEALATWRP